MKRRLDLIRDLLCSYGAEQFSVFSGLDGDLHSFALQAVRRARAAAFSSAILRAFASFWDFMTFRLLLFASTARPRGSR